MKLQQNQLSSHVTTKQAGFTLIELILSIALSSLVITSVVLLTWNLISGSQVSSTHQTLSYQLGLVSDRIQFEVRNASSITSVTSTTLTLANATAGRNPTVISFAGGVVSIGWGNSGSCPVASPCPLTADPVTITNLTFTDFSVGDSAHVEYSLSGEITGDRSEFQDTQSISGSAEVLTD